MGGRKDGAASPLFSNWRGKRNSGLRGTILELISRANSCSGRLCLFLFSVEDYRPVSPIPSLQTMKRPHPQRHRTLSPRTATTTPSTNTNCTLYLSPSPLSLQPVFTPLLLTWNPLCLSPNPDKIDLYLETLNTTTGVLTPVHEWTGVDFSSGMLATEFDPNWWGEGTGAGEVEAGLLMTGVGDPVWMSLGTPGPTFTITYNGSWVFFSRDEGEA